MYKLSKGDKMSTYKVVDSTISVLYCAKCANEFLEIMPPNRIVCTDCGMVATFDPGLIRVGQLQGTKYKMRDKRRYSFREIADEARQDAFKEVYVPSPEPGRGRTGWRDEEKEEETSEQPIKMAGVDDAPRKGWRSDKVLDILASDESDKEEGYDAGTNGNGNHTGNGTICPT
jgi:hypothetical protein